MRTLTEVLYTNNVLFSYYGFIDSKVLTQVLNITRSKLESNNESIVVVKRVYSAINECVENIIKHNFFPGDALLNYKSLLLVSMGDKSYSIDTINVVNSKQKAAIIEKLNFLQTKTKEELLAIKSKLISDSSNMDDSDNGLGLVDLVLKTNNFKFDFKEYNENFLFSINFKINTTN
ncbi:MAG: DUF6272 family protein [Bacteroidota bacterium]|nr:DUF6272 family protein [Bacteroidota bacterium]MDP3146355.1 DUF6272 family protein [Bacteroidota bacterium]MDP3556353.1 DUF6272 family protein [Bacteroidota bacterium]